ncbi:MAG: FHA domain-containing protein [Sandaracinus sp.]
MNRYRLRFLLQEFDLHAPEVIIGRSSECHITIEDPLISRQHARILIEGDEARIADMGSRNGVRVNGRLVKGEQALKDGDRIRLGTQELLFSMVGRAERAPRPTGYMKLCHACGTPYPEGAPSCPHCGAPALAEEDTMSGAAPEPKRSWTFQLLGEVIERALASGRAVEAERLMRKAAKEIDERLASGERLDAGHTGMIAAFAVRLAKLVGGSEWVAWAVALHRRQNLMLSDQVIDRLDELDPGAFPDLRTLLDSYVSWWRAQSSASASGPSPDLARLTRLEQLQRG